MLLPIQILVKYFILEKEEKAESMKTWIKAIASNPTPKS